MEDYGAFTNAARAASVPPPPFSATTAAALGKIQEPLLAARVGLSPGAIVDALGALFAKYEIPIGVVAKLLALQEFDELEFLVDDSGSMNTDLKKPVGSARTRWEEAKQRLETLIEILAYVPIPLIEIRFLNRPDKILLTRRKEVPELWIAQAKEQINRAFSNSPAESTPMLERLRDSLQEKAAKKVSRYVLGDGCPNGGPPAERAIGVLIQGRRSPRDNPITFLPCSDNDADVAWMEYLKETAAWCSSIDDFESESKEVRRDQGEALPYSEGLYLVSLLVAAINPDDLDALDKSVPLAKSTLDALYGIEYTNEQYRHYFTAFQAAQSKKPRGHGADRVIAEENWERSYHDFLTARRAADIRQVQEFRDRLAREAEENWGRSYHDFLTVRRALARESEK
jgi:hypothetical protein